MWHWTPFTVSTPFNDPRRPFLIVSPSRSDDVGSPTMQASMLSPRARNASTTAAVPCSASPSSSDVSSIAIDPGWSGLVAAIRPAAVTIAATDPFMSAAPRPNSRPSRTTPAKGSHRPLIERARPVRRRRARPGRRAARRCRAAPRGSRRRRGRGARSGSRAARDATPRSPGCPRRLGVTDRQAMSCCARWSVSA